MTETVEGTLSNLPAYIYSIYIYIIYIIYILVCQKGLEKEIMGSILLT